MFVDKLGAKTELEAIIKFDFSKDRLVLGDNRCCTWLDFVGLVLQVRQVASLMCIPNQTELCIGKPSDYAAVERPT